MASGNGITNSGIEKFFDDKTNEDLKRKFMGVYPSDSITKYINFHAIIKEKRAKYPFTILNTDRKNKPGTDWWGFLDFHPKRDLLLFDSFGFLEFKQFIVDNDKNIIDKMLFNLEKFNKKNTKINLVSLTFSIESYKQIKKKSLDNLTNTAKDFFRLLSEFGKTKKQKKEMKIILLDGQLQELTTDTCGVFQLYFCKNLFDSVRDSIIIDDEFLTKKTVKTLLNAIFSKNKERNEEEMKSFVRDNDL